MKDTSDILDSTFRFEEEDWSPPALSRSRSVSVSVNRASYITEESSGNLVDLQPVCRSLNLDLGSSSVGASGLISQDSFLERNIRAREAETLDLISNFKFQFQVSISSFNFKFQFSKYLMPNFTKYISTK